MRLTLSMVVVTLFCFLLLFTPWFTPKVFAQTPPTPTDYTMTTHLASAPNGTPISSYSFLKSAMTCDQVPSTVPPVVMNPRYIRITDPDRPTRDCVLDTGTTTGPLFAMPVGGRYIAKLIGKVFIDGVEVGSPESDPSNPFVRAVPPVKPAGVRIGG